MEKIKKSERMETIAQEVMEEHKEDLGWIEDYGFKIAYVYSNKQKKNQGNVVFGECRKCDPTMKALAGCDFVITFFEENTKLLNNKQLHILMYHELLHIETGKNGKAEIAPHNYVINDFRQVVDKYGVDWAVKGGDIEK